MPNPLITSAQSVLNWFKREPHSVPYYQTGSRSLYDSFNRHATQNIQSTLSAVYNRIAVDVANVPIKHVVLNSAGDYTADKDSMLNDVLTVSANSDQTPQAFMIDAVLSLFEEGQIAIVPETTKNPYTSNDWDVVSLRVAKILSYHPNTVSVEIYDETDGTVREWRVYKEHVAIIENPLFYIMNKTNATFRRLSRTLSMLDQVNDESINGKIDLIIHVPYTIHSDMRQKMAEQRRKDIENQLRNSKYGIAYMDPTETVTQLNRPANNTLREQVDALTLQAFNQLGVTEGILNGTADERTMANYRSRIIGMLLKAFTQEYRRKFLTPTARGQHQDIICVFDVFEFATGKEMADVMKTLKEAEVASTDEMRARMGRGPDPSGQGSKIQNPNINPASADGPEPAGEEPFSEIENDPIKPPEEG